MDTRTVPRENERDTNEDADKVTRMNPSPPNASWPQTVRIRIPASTAHLGSGFESLALALAQYNTFILEASDDLEISINTRNLSPHSSVQFDTNQNNLVWRAACEVFRRSGRKLKGMKIRVDLTVPLERGLGSSATAILAGAIGANRLVGSPLSDEDLLRMVIQFEGYPNNVTASFYGGLIAVMMRKRKPHIRRYKVASDLRVITAVAPYALSDEKVRAALPKEVSHADAVHSVQLIPFLIGALCEGDMQALSLALDDRLHEPYRIPLIRNGRAIRKAAVAAGAAGVTISGAGPTLAAFCRAAEAEAVAEAVRSQLKSGSAEILKVDHRGMRVTVK